MNNMLIAKGERNFDGMPFNASSDIGVGELLVGGALLWLALRVLGALTNGIKTIRNDIRLSDEIRPILEQNEEHFGIGKDMAKHLSVETLPYYKGIIEGEKIAYLSNDKIKDVP